MSDSVRPHRRQPTRLLLPWDFPGKSTGVGCHCLLPDRFLEVDIFHADAFSPWSFKRPYQHIKPTVSRSKPFFLPMLDIITFKICISLILSEHKCHFSTSGHLLIFCELPILVFWPFICCKIKLDPVIWRDSAYFRLLCMLPLMAVTCLLSLVYSSCLGKFSPL